MKTIDSVIQETLQELKERWQLDKNIFNYAFIKTEYLYDDGFDSDEVDEICEKLVDEFNKYIKHNVKCDALAKYDGDYVYIEEIYK